MPAPWEIMRDHLQKLAAGRDLTSADAGAAMDAVIAGEATPAQVGAFVALLRVKGEATSEIAGCAAKLQERTPPIELGIRPEALVQMSATGCERPLAFNVAAGSALVASASGVKVVKVTVRGSAGTIGSADVLAALGVNVDAPLFTHQRCMQEVGIAFPAAQVCGEAVMRFDAPRRELGFRSIFHLLGAVVSPFGAKRLVAGVSSEKLVEPVATVLKKLGVQQALVVHGLDGIDEISTAGKSKICEVAAGGAPEASYLQPESFGFKRGPSITQPKTAEESALLLNAVLTGQPSPARDAVILNAAAAIRVGGFASSFDKAVEVAKRSLASGRPKEILERLIKLTVL